jgi:hypothetical protein
MSRTSVTKAARLQITMSVISPYDP